MSQIAEEGRRPVHLGVMVRAEQRRELRERAEQEDRSVSAVTPCGNRRLPAQTRAARCLTISPGRFFAWFDEQPRTPTGVLVPVGRGQMQIRSAHLRTQSGVRGSRGACPSRHVSRALCGKLRRLPESNRCTRFCRPVPNHSAKAPRAEW